MATGNMHGDVALWDLAKRKLAHIIKGAHSGLISSVAFLHNQPVLVTAGSDNAVKVSNETFFHIILDLFNLTSSA